jgi:hypothetical protein
MSVTEDIAAEAVEIVSKGRRQAYGAPERSFESIARLWNAYLRNRRIIADDGLIGAVDVALMMDLLKTARLANDPAHRDSWADKVGYALCGAEIGLAGPKTVAEYTASAQVQGAYDTLGRRIAV